MPRLPFSGSEVSKAPSYLKYGNYITSTENGPPSELTTDTFHDKSMDFHRRRSRQVLNAGGSPVGRKGWRVSNTVTEGCYTVQHSGRGSCKASLLWHMSQSNTKDLTKRFCGCQHSVLGHLLVIDIPSYERQFVLPLTIIDPHPDAWVERFATGLAGLVNDTCFESHLLLVVCNRPIG